MELEIVADTPRYWKKESYTSDYSNILGYNDKIWKKRRLSIFFRKHNKLQQQKRIVICVDMFDFPRRFEYFYKELDRIFLTELLCAIYSPKCTKKELRQAFCGFKVTARGIKKIINN